jgi:hypothetical protein
MIRTFEELFTRLEKTFTDNNIIVSMDNVKAIIEGSATKADGNIFDIIETLADYCEATAETKELINTLHSIA